MAGGGGGHAYLILGRTIPTAIFVGGRLELNLTRACLRGIEIEWSRFQSAPLLTDRGAGACHSLREPVSSSVMGMAHPIPLAPFIPTLWYMYHVHHMVGSPRARECPARSSAFLQSFYAATSRAELSLNHPPPWAPFSSPLNTSSHLIRRANSSAQQSRPRLS